MLHRLLHAGDQPVLVRVAQLSPDRVLFGGQARTTELAEWGIERMRLALGIDHDLRPFHERFRFDPLIGASLRANPGLRAAGKPDPFEALAWAICEQLIEFERAAAIERRLVFKLGRRCPVTGMRDAPTAQAIAQQAPALLASFDLSESRAIALGRVARRWRAVASTSTTPTMSGGWRRLRSIRGVGSWTLQMLALTGQGRLDQLPAGDLAYLEVRRTPARRRRSVGAGERRGSEEVFAPYAPWAGLAGLHALRAGGVSATPMVA